MNTLQQLVLIALATFVSEDLTTIHTGTLIQQRQIGAFAGLLACFCGIFIGDLLIYCVGRIVGRAALQRAPLSWFLNEAAVERSSHWLSKRGAFVILASRFLPGTRLPTYFAAGLLRTSLKQFTGYFLLASALWTPLLLGLSAWLGGYTLLRGEWLTLAFFTVSLWWLVRTMLQLLSRRGRRLWIGQWRRLVRWEFWPPYVFYPPVIVYILWLAIKHRGFTLFTAVNPVIPASGFVGESKSEILRGLSGTSELIACHTLLRAQASVSARQKQAELFMNAQGLSFPVVLKPDAGQRGAGVRVIRSAAELAVAIATMTSDHILQEYVAGVEFGVFYLRYPEAEQGTIFSITEKRFPSVTGNGQQTLEQLVLNDERAVCLAKLYEARLCQRWSEIIPAGEPVALAELGSHCRGAIFLDGKPYLTKALNQTIERISQSCQGFYFGRYDIRAASVEDFQRGAFKVIELNGVTAEATHIYDPRYSVWQAYRVLFAQWRAAFAIGAANQARGARVYSLSALATMAWQFYRKPDANKNDSICDAEFQPAPQA